MDAPIDGARRGWWLEDAVPGGIIRHPGGRTIDEAEHVWLAWITHNVSPVHGNADAAGRSEWGEPLVLGMLTVAIVLGLAAPATGPPETVGAGWSESWQSITLALPVVAGDTIRATSRIEAVDSSIAVGLGLVRRTIMGLNQRGELVATIGEVRTVPRRPSASGP